MRFCLAAAMPFSVGKQLFGLGDTKFFGGPVSSRSGEINPGDPRGHGGEALQRAAALGLCASAGKILCVFPEGSRSRDGKIKEFKKGVAIIAKELNVPLVPVAITGTFEMMRPGQLFPRPGKVTVTFGKAALSGRDGLRGDHEETVRGSGGASGAEGASEAQRHRKDTEKYGHVVRSVTSSVSQCL